MRNACLRSAGILFGAFIAMQGQAGAALVTLQNATATYSQPIGNGYSVAQAIDGDFGDWNGWAIAQAPAVQTAFAETAVFETANDIGSSAGTMLTFSLYQLHWNPGHNLGRFRLSVTTDSRTQFADGLGTNGDVSANWTVLHPVSALATNELLLSVQGDDSLLASGPNPDTSVYTISAFTSLANITGIRLEALEDISLPQHGPGRRAENGNFGLTEFTVSASPVPEPGSLLMLTAGLGFLGLLGWKRIQNGSF